MGVHGNHIICEIVKPFIPTERSDEFLQGGKTEGLRVIPPGCMGVEDASVHVTGGKAELFGCIVHQDLERIVYQLVRWCLQLVCFVGYIHGRCSTVITQLTTILLLHLHHLLPLHLEDLQRCVNHIVVGGAECWLIKAREIPPQFPSKPIVLNLKT